jgi:hypothetical protein
MHRYAYIKRKRPVIHHVNGEEQSGADAPFAKGDRRGCDEVRGGRRELVMQGRSTCEDELEEGYEESAVGFVSVWKKKKIRCSS